MELTEQEKMVVVELYRSTCTYPADRMAYTQEFDRLDAAV